eukprot:900503-Amphidinium_carterae.1
MADPSNPSAAASVKTQAGALSYVTATALGGISSTFQAARCVGPTARSSRALKNNTPERDQSALSKKTEATPQSGRFVPSRVPSRSILPSPSGNSFDLLSVIDMDIAASRATEIDRASEIEELAKQQVLAIGRRR